MMTNGHGPFKKATKEQSRARIALIGPSGSGKTYSALAIASGLGNSVAVIDTERGSAAKYASLFDFDVAELPDFNPKTYVAMIQAADAAGYDVLVIDSLSHAWNGRGGALEMVDQEAARSSSKNTFAAWRTVTPIHNALVDAILGCRAHVIVTMRAKTEYVIETDARGKQAPRKVGLAPIQRDGVEYEFDIVGDLDPSHTLIISKTRCPGLDGAVIPLPGVDFSVTVLAWLTDGAEPSTRLAREVTAATVVEILGKCPSLEKLAEIQDRMKKLPESIQLDPDVATAYKQTYGRLTDEEAESKAGTELNSEPQARLQFDGVTA